jgi:type I site-specific restriction-modification system R (restriction) subunit
VVIEIKNATDEKATTKTAFDQLQTYKQAIPILFNYNAFLIATDGWFSKQEQLPVITAVFRHGKHMMREVKNIVV